MPQLWKKPTAATVFSRRQSSAACTPNHHHLPEDAAIANRRTVEDRSMEWEIAEQRLTSAFFLVWAVSVALLGGWQLAHQF